MGWDIFFLLLLIMITFSRYVTGLSAVEPAAILLLFAFSLLLREYRRQKRSDFINQLKSHRRELRAGGTVVVDSLLLRYDSVVTSYSLTIGALFSNVTVPSIYRTYTGETQPDSFFYSLATLFTGWWSVTGPMCSIEVILSNLNGGEKTSVAMLIDAPLFRNNLDKELKSADFSGEAAKASSDLKQR